MTSSNSTNHETIYASYVDALRDAVPAINNWWTSLLNRHGPPLVSHHWPCQAASHPRIITIYREYYDLCNDLNDQPVTSTTPSDDESAWGDAHDDDPPESSPWVHPAELLIDDLEHVSPELFEFMSHLVLCPVGSAVEVDLTLVPSSPPPIFTAPTRHDVALGVSRLLGAPRDLGPDMDWRERDPVQPSADHLRLFTAYRAHLERALTTAVDWWCRIIRQRELEGRSRDDAILAAFDLVFCGAVSHLDVIGVIRAYWLACEAINAQLPRTSWLAPERMLLAWLLDGHHDSWVAILTAMPYWPLGLDENGVWV